MLAQMLANWKTTMAGILAILGGIVRLYFAWSAGAFTEEVFMTTASAILGGVGLLFARDSNVTSEASGVK